MNPAEFPQHLLDLMKKEDERPAEIEEIVAEGRERNGWPGETLQSLGFKSRMVISKERALEPGEARGKIFLLAIKDSSNPCKFLFDWIFSSGVTWKQMKSDLLDEMKRRFSVEIPPEKLVFRENAYGWPSFIPFRDEEEVLETEKRTIFQKGCQFYLQVLDLDDENEMAAEYTLRSDAIFTRRWYPSTLTMGNMVSKSFSILDRIELGRVLTASSGLPAERIEISKGRGDFPCGLLWNPWIPLLLFNGPFYDGNIIFWRDKDEPLFKFTPITRQP